MSINVLYVFSVIICLISCSEKLKKENQVAMVKITYAPSFHTGAEILLNEKENYIILKSLRRFIPIIKEDGYNTDNKKFMSEIAPVSDTIIEVKNEEFIKLNSIISTLKKEDFADVKLPAFDGMTTNILIVYQDHSMKIMQPMNLPNDKQRQILTELVKLVERKNTSTDNKTVLKSIISYLD